MQQPAHAAMVYCWNTACVLLLEEPTKWSPSSRWTTQQVDPFCYVLEWDVFVISVVMFCGCSKEVKEKGLFPSRVPSRENPADLGTKRLAKERMEYLMCLCKVYNIDTSEFVGINAYDKVQEQDNMKASIPLLKEQGRNTPKQLLRILLLALSPSKMAMAVSMDGV